MTEKRIIPNYSILLLVAPQFHAVEVCSLTRYLRQFGISIVLTSLKEGVVNSEFDITLKPDCSIECLQLHLPYSGIILTGSEASTRMLLRDPRVHRLLELNSRSSHGLLVGTTSAEIALRDLGVLESYHSWILQRDQSMPAFAKRIASTLMQIN